MSYKYKVGDKVKFQCEDCKVSHIGVIIVLLRDTFTHEPYYVVKTENDEPWCAESILELVE